MSKTECQRQQENQSVYFHYGCFIKSGISDTSQSVQTHTDKQLVIPVMTIISFLVVCWNSPLKHLFIVQLFCSWRCDPLWKPSEIFVCNHIHVHSGDSLWVKPRQLSHCWHHFARTCYHPVTYLCLNSYWRYNRSSSAVYCPCRK